MDILIIFFCKHIPHYLEKNRQTNKNGNFVITIITKMDKVLMVLS